MNLPSGKDIVLNLRLWQKPGGWLAAIALTLAIIHLTMIWRVAVLSYAGLSFLFYFAVASLIWDKRETLNLKSGLFATCLGIALLIPLLLKSIFLMELSTSSLFIFPPVAGFSLALLASGGRGLSQYGKELLLLLTLGLTQPLANLINNFDPSMLTAKFATAVLWYSGFDVARKGADIYWGEVGKGVEVYPGCSGVDAVLHLLSLTLLFFILFPTDRKTKLWLPLAAIVIGFVGNGLRVSLLAVIVALHQQKGFEYWHSGEGSLLFSMVSAGLLCGIAFWLTQNAWDQEHRTAKGEDNTGRWP